MPRKRSTTKTAEVSDRRFSLSRPHLWIFLAIIVGGVMYFLSYSDTFAVKYDGSAVLGVSGSETHSTVFAPLDVDAYNAKLRFLAHIPIATTTASTTVMGAEASSTASTTRVRTLWPAPVKAYPLPGALLPFNRIVAYYGNFYSKGMGVLGEYPESELVPKLETELAAWRAADPSTPVIPAIDYIAVTAQGSPEDGTYRLRMPDSEIEKAIDLAHQVNGIVVLDVQVGLSSVQAELPHLAKFLSMPDVHLALDPEFSMKSGQPPGRVIGTMDAADINYAAHFLSALVKANNLPPKILIVHRFTEDMVTGYKNIVQLPEVQVVMDMDGWGSPAKKTGTYKQVIYPEPVEFTGFKLFYKNDLRAPSTRMMTPSEILSLTPAPSFIQYQ